MKILTQAAVLFLICLAGAAVSQLLPFPFPASVLAMLLLFLLLLSGAVKQAQIEETSDFLLKNMALLFIPSGVGILQSYEAVAPHLLPLIAVCVITTVLVFAVTAFTVGAVIRLQERLKGGGRNG